MSIRERLNLYNLPAQADIQGKPVRPTDLTQKKVVYWLITNLAFWNPDRNCRSMEQALQNLLRVKRW